MNGKKETKGKDQGEFFNTSSPLSKMKWYAWSVAAGWTALLIGLLAWDVEHLHQDAENFAIKEARANFNKDQAFRYWASSHGGVYAPVDENTPPNPYLKHIPERDITTPSGKKLTLMNPAYMVRQMNEFFTKEYGIVGHITSLKLHNPDNVPDEWERKALEAFEKGEKELLEFSDIDGAPYIRLMQPLMTKKGCLKCHAYQGYKVGDVRGGVSVSMSMSDLLAERNKKILNQGLSHGIIWLLGLAGLFVGYVKVRRYFFERIYAEEKMQEAEEKATALLNATLESLILIDLEGKVLAVNKTGASRLNTTQDYLVGKNIFSFMPPELVEARRKLISEIVHTRKSVTLEDRRENRDVYTNLVPVQNGGIHAIAVFSQDITERKLADMAIRESEERLKEAQRITHMGHWDLDLVSNKLHWSDEIYRIFEIDKERFGASFDAFLNIIHPDDREFVNKTYTESVKEREPYDIVHRLLMKDGTLKYVNEKCRTEYDDNGKALRSLGTVQDITTAKEAEMQLGKAKEEAEAASRAKTDFLSRMSHELRTPLNSILGFAQIMQSYEGKLDDKQGLCVEEIVSAGWHLTDLVNEVLDISKVEAGTLSLNVGPVDICPIMEECINMITPLAEEKNIEVSCNLKVCNKETVWGDDTRLKEVFLNLLSNAVKYNVESGTVRISCDKIDEERLLISVDDSGKGISEEDQKILFKPFSRIKGEDPAIQGTGIGLAISKHLVELMNGSIGMESSPGRGSTFWVKLQIAEDASS